MKGMVTMIGVYHTSVPVSIARIDSLRMLLKGIR